MIETMEPPLFATIKPFDAFKAEAAFAPFKTAYEV
jgi:hypothetical protein